MSLSFSITNNSGYTNNNQVIVSSFDIEIDYPLPPLINGWNNEISTGSYRIPNSGNTVGSGATSENQITFGLWGDTEVAMFKAELSLTTCTAIANPPPSNQYLNQVCGTDGSLYEYTASASMSGNQCNIEVYVNPLGRQCQP